MTESFARSYFEFIVCVADATSFGAARIAAIENSQ
jgi:hypothetical protein